MGQHTKILVYAHNSQGWGESPNKKYYKYSRHKFTVDLQLNNRVPFALAQ